MQTCKYDNSPTHNSESDKPPPLATSSELCDVWIHIIGPNLSGIDILNLSLVSRWGHAIAHKIQTHQDYAPMSLKKVSIADLEICRVVERVWPHLRVCLVLEDWCNTTSPPGSGSNNKVSSNVLMMLRPMTSFDNAQPQQKKDPVCRPAALTLHRGHASDFDFVDPVRLERIVLKATRLSGMARLSLLHCMKAAQATLTTIEISGGWLGQEGVKDISLVICQMPHVHTLHLAFHELTADEIRPLVPALQRMPHITSLSLFGNSLGAIGAQHIAAALCNLVHLRTLDLRQNEFGPEGARHLSSVLGSLTTITSLNLCTNQMGSIGVMCLVPALTRLTRMSALNLAFNDIDPATKEQLFQSLEYLPRSVPL